MYDVFYIGEADNGWTQLRKRFPLAKRASTISDAQLKSFTKMFWAVWADLEILDSFKFDYVIPEYDQTFVHVFRNGNYFDGICLFPKNKEFSKREIEYRFFTDKKEIDIQASISKLYDVVFISYNEPNAEDNYSNLLQIHPSAKRIHGVTGIHQAHIEAAKISNTEMFWVVDGDAQIHSDFKFDYQVHTHNRNTVHVWRSCNPVNGLEYGYGGVKLLPRSLTLNMDLSKTDMTTGISMQFKVMDQISNITAFNTDPFNTWKSAFRECVKLSSKIIDGQVDTETEQRLDTWCNKWLDDSIPNVVWAIEGARDGRCYGTENVGNLEALKKINDFDWLHEQFSKYSV